MAIVLVVVHSFEDFKVGEIVSDEMNIVDIVGGEHANRVVRVLFSSPPDDQSEDI